MTLKKYSAESDLTRSVTFFDDFIGNINTVVWARYGAGSIGYPTNPYGGQLRIRANANSYYRMVSDNANISLANGFTLRWRAQIYSTLLSRDIACGALGAVNDTSNFVDIAYDSTVSTNWILRTANGGTLTTTNLGVAATTAWTDFKIEASSSGVAAYINGVLLGVSTTNLPTVALCAGAGSRSYTTSTRDIYVDYCHYVGGRV